MSENLDRIISYLHIHGGVEYLSDVDIGVRIIIYIVSLFSCQYLAFQVSRPLLSLIVGAFITGSAGVGIGCIELWIWMA